LGYLDVGGISVKIFGDETFVHNERVALMTTKREPVNERVVLTKAIREPVLAPKKYNLTMYH